MQESKINRRLSETMRLEIPLAAQKGARKGPPAEAPPAAAPPAPSPVPDLDAHDFQELFQSVYDAAVITMPDGRIADANIRAEAFFVMGRAAFRSSSILDLVWGASETHLADIRKSLRDERFVLMQAFCRKHNGELFPAEIAVNRLMLSGNEYLCFFVRDITERKKAEEKLQTEHQAIQNAGNGIAMSDLHGKLNYVNPAVLRFWGFDGADQITHGDVRSLWAAPGAMDEIIAAVVDTAQNWEGELPARRFDGSQADMRVSVVLSRDLDGNPVGLVYSFVDVSDRRRAEDARREAERQKVMLESIGGACHYLCQPATVLTTNLDLIGQEIGKPTDCDEATAGRAVVMDLVSMSLRAAAELKDTLHKLNTLGEYRTTEYLDGPEAKTRILDL